MNPNSGRWAGPAAILAGILWSGSFILQEAAPAALDTEPYTVTNAAAQTTYALMFLAAVLLFAAALIGLYARQMGRAGVLGKVGAALTVIGALLFVPGAVLAAWPAVDGAWYVMMAGIAALPVSLLVLGIATMLTRVLGRWSSIPLLVGVLSVGVFVSAFLGLFRFETLGMWSEVAPTSLVGAGWVLLGFTLAVGSPAESAGTDLRPA